MTEPQARLLKFAAAAKPGGEGLAALRGWEQNFKSPPERAGGNPTRAVGNPAHTGAPWCTSGGGTSVLRGTKEDYFAPFALIQAWAAILHPDPAVSLSGR